MKNLIFGIVTITTLLLSCTPDNPNPNGNGGQTYTQGIPVTDIDGNTYPTIISDCGQTWTAKNLNVSKYRNGDVIPQVADFTQWQNLTTGAYCWYNNDSSNYWQYGKLYNWYALNDPRGLTPQGWHIPNKNEWTLLQTCLGGDQLAGGAMKEIGTAHWYSPNTGATNSSGFTALAGGIRSSILNFIQFGQTSHWWSSTETIPSFFASGFYLNYSQASSFIDDEGESENDGYSIRCVKD